MDIANRNTKLINRVKSVKDLSRALIEQLFAMIPLFFILSLFIWFFFIRKDYPGREVSTFLLYVIGPLVVQAFASTFLMLVNAMGKHIFGDDNYTEKEAYRIHLCIGFTMYFSTVVYFYGEIPAIWLFQGIPLLIVCFYRQVKWMVTEIITQVTFLLIYMLIPLTTETPIINISKMEVFVVLTAVSVLGGVYAVSLHVYIDILIDNVVKIRATEEARTMYFAKISHEIRTPINAILGMDEMILRETDDDEIIKYADNIKNAGKSILSLVNEILDQAKLEAGKLEIVEEKYDLTSVLNDCYNLVYLRAGDRGLEFTVNSDPTCPEELYGDDVRIRQVITNLLTNAIKYTKEGYVKFNIGWQKLSGDQMNLIVSVEDSGIGISKDNLPYIFDSYDRADKKEVNHIEGTGLGLYITKQLLDMMQGEIKVESVHRKGSTFTVTIPQKIVGDKTIGDFAKNVNLRLKERPKYQERFQAPDAEILVVDDVDMNLDVFKGLLKRTLVKIDAVTSGRKALELIEKKKYDIIFLDHVMPEMDGVETLKRMQIMDHRNQGTPVIALTANASKGAKEEYEALGFTDYLAKPVRGNALEEMILKYLRVNRIEKRTTPREPERKEDNFLKKVSFLDTETGLSCAANDLNLYKQIIRDYMEETRGDILKKAFSEEDYETYQVNIHALKSTSLSIGATDLSEEAKKLETAVKEKNLDYLRENHEACMRHYEQLLAKLDMAF